MDQFFEKVFNPYLAGMKKHCQILQLKDGVVHKKDLEEPSKEGDEKTRLEEAVPTAYEMRIHQSRIDAAVGVLSLTRAPKQGKSCVCSVLRVRLHRAIPPRIL